MDFSSDGIAQMMGPCSVVEERQCSGTSVHPVGTAERLTVVLIAQMARTLFDGKALQSAVHVIDLSDQPYEFQKVELLDHQTRRDHH